MTDTLGTSAAVGSAADATGIEGAKRVLDVVRPQLGRRPA